MIKTLNIFCFQYIRIIYCINITITIVIIIYDLYRNGFVETTYEIKMSRQLYMTLQRVFLASKKA